jgi:uncharacterized protein
VNGLAVDGGTFAGHDPETGHKYSLAELLADQARLGISCSFVGSYRALYSDVREGNEEAAAWARSSGGRVVPLGILQPRHHGGPQEVLRHLHGLGIRVAAVFSEPAYYPVEWRSPVLRCIGEDAAKLGIALQAGLRDDGELAAVAQAWGDLDVPVFIRWMGGHRYRVLAAEIEVASRCPRFHFDVANACSVAAIERLAARVGAARLFVATGAPRTLPDCATAILAEAVLDQGDREWITGGTLRRALGIEPPVAHAGGAPSDWADWCSRPKVDVHWHPDHWNLGEGLSDAEQQAVFDRFGYERVLLSSILALNYDLEAGNERTRAWLDRDRRAAGLIVVNPHHVERSLEQVRRHADDPRFVGLKTIQDLHGLRLDDAAYAPILAEAGRRGLPILAHLPGIGEAARRHPEVTFVAAHANWGRARSLQEHANVFFDFATGHALRHETQLGRFIDAVGASRVLFGSDGGLVTPAWSLAKLRHAGRPPHEVEAILRGNAHRVFPRL